MTTKTRIAEMWKQLCRCWAFLPGLAALVWFLVRVIPKPSRASYPCQRAAFPLASAFVVWLCASVISVFSLVRLRQLVHRFRYAAAAMVSVTALSIGIWTLHTRAAAAAGIATRYNFEPQTRNVPLGEARGVFPGRVVWAHDPLAAHWNGKIQSSTDEWWMDSSTDQVRVDAMLSITLRKLTGGANDQDAWKKIFAFYNHRSRGLERGYRAGEIVAVKVNLNNSGVEGPGNIVNVSPQATLAMVRQLVLNAHVRRERHRDLRCAPRHLSRPAA